jgi:hypothetical protein
MLTKVAVVVPFMIVTLVQPAFSMDESEIRSAIQSHICPASEIDTTDLPDYRRCKRYDDAHEYTNLMRCQDEANRFAGLVRQYNDLYRSCLGHDPRSSAKPKAAGPNEPSTPTKQAQPTMMEQNQFDLATKMDSVAGWKAFLRTYPDGVNAEWAKKRLNDLEGGAATETEKPKSPTIEVNRRPFSGKLQASVSSSTESTMRYYFNGNLQKTSTKEKAGTLRFSVWFDERQGYYQEIGHSTVFNCGLNQYLNTSWSINESSHPQSNTTRCKIAREANSISMYLQADYRLESQDDAGATGRTNMYMSFVFVQDTCRVVTYDNDNVIRTHGMIHYDIDAKGHLSSGNCQISR